MIIKPIAYIHTDFKEKFGKDAPGEFVVLEGSDQKKNDEALALFQTIKDKYLGSPAQQDVDKYIEYLTK